MIFYMNIFILYVCCQIWIFLFQGFWTFFQIDFAQKNVFQENLGEKSFWKNNKIFLLLVEKRTGEWYWLFVLVSMIFFSINRRETKLFLSFCFKVQKFILMFQYKIFMKSKLKQFFPKENLKKWQKQRGEIEIGNIDQMVAWSSGRILA